MFEGTTYVGLDAHKKSIAVAMLLPDQARAIQWEVANSETEIRRLARKLKRQAPGEIRSCYEAGPTGYGIQRILEAEGIVCEVVAPSLIPVKPGERIKTDRRDARKLAELLRAGILTEVRAPTPEEESIRDLCRCREDAKEDQTRSRHRLTKLLLRRGLHYGTGKPWTLAYRRWLASLHFHAADRVVFGDYLRALELVEERLKALDAALEEFAAKEPYASPVGWLRCHHGIGTLSAMMLVAELYNIRRFESARSLMAYLGLVPSEYSSGEGKSRGAITKSGNRHVRRLLVEAAHHFRHRPRVSPILKKRRAGQPPIALAIADRAHDRLHRRYWRLIAKGKATNTVKVAIARELAGFVWATLHACAEATTSKRAAA